MGIVFDKINSAFHLQTRNTSYIMHVLENRFLCHTYWGKRLNNTGVVNSFRLDFKNYSAVINIDNKNIFLDALAQEYPGYGISDFRDPAFQIQYSDGSTISDLRYKSFKIYKGKNKLVGLPCTYSEKDEKVETLDIELSDDVSGLKVILSYSVFEDYDAITRSTVIINDGESKFSILRSLSANVDFDCCDFDLLTLNGAWANERSIVKRPLAFGRQLAESKRGSSSHQQNPFIALLKKDATEDSGDVYGFSLVYSGNFIAQAEVDQYKTTRVSIGINPFDFSWLLEPGETFQSPEVVMVYSDNGLGQMSRIYHKLYRTRLCRGYFRDKTRPVLVNNWEATYMNFNEDKIKEIAKVGSELGIELFVLDDGWFGKRDNDDCSLGDWVENKRKLPNGLNNLAESINNMNMKFGLWFEPEMVSPNSDLYTLHPDWCIHVPDRERTESRHQLVLDFSRKDVCDYISDALISILKSVPISYVKWDMNRNMTEIGSAALPANRQRETAHRYMLGLYSVLEKITSTCENVLFESCSGGGGRFDPGMLYYMPQTWTSDNTDAIERLKIQYGTSIVYPISTMGAHVSVSPNHFGGRTISLKTRGNVAMSGNFGYELDLTKFSVEEKEIVKEQVKTYKSLRKLVQFGDFYRLLSPFEGNDTSWMFVNENKSEAYVVYVRTLKETNGPIKKLKLKGLDSNKKYKSLDTNETFYGDQLMYAGINIPYLEGDFESITFRLTEVY